MLERIELEAVSLDRVELEVADLISEPSPLDDVEYPGDVEGDCAAELAKVESEFEKRSNREDKRRRKVNDSEYWCCLCFQNREQVEAFLTATKWAVPSAKYIDGVKVAEKLNIPLPADEIGYPAVRVDRTWVEMAKEKSNEA
jgi:hypothetical protein